MGFQSKRTQEKTSLPLGVELEYCSSSHAPAWELALPRSCGYAALDRRVYIPTLERRYKNKTLVSDLRLRIVFEIF